MVKHPKRRKNQATVHSPAAALQKHTAGRLSERGHADGRSVKPRGVIRSRVWQWQLVASTCALNIYQRPLLHPFSELPASRPSLASFPPLNTPLKPSLNPQIIPGFVAPILPEGYITVRFQSFVSGFEVSCGD